LIFESHKILKNENIPHKISDFFINEADRLKLQKEIFRFSKWYEQIDVKEILEYEGVNLGKLYYMELFIFLIPFLKFFYELKKISTQYNDSKFYASGMIYEILSKFNINLTLFQTKTKNSQFLDDSINIQTNFFKINIRKNSFRKLKNFSEIFLSTFTLINKKLQMNSPFLVEFNTILYENLFLEIHRNNLDFAYFGIRRPSIWNSKSYSIIKQSRCYVATESGILISELKKTIETQTEEIKSKWKQLFQNDNFFNLFFTYEQITFWPSLKPFFMKLYNSRLDDSIKIINITKKYLKTFKPSHILVLSESGTTEQIIISLAKNFKIPVILIQHGMGGSDSKESDVIHGFTGSMLIQSDKFFVWGEHTKQYALNFGIPSEKIFVMGSCAHDNLFNNSFNTMNHDYILFFPESPSNNHINDYTIKVNEEYEDILKTVCTIATKLNKKLIIKLHPYIKELNETKIAKSISPNIEVIKKGDASSLIKSCSLLITSGLTSAMIDAAYLKKPIIRIKSREWWGEIDTLRPDSAITIKIDNLENIINQLFSDPTFYQTKIQIGIDFVNACISNQGTASKKVSQFLKKII